jgi:2-polyprenyl-3-methyl-5-hydroxy-6-metoxy-1,4-benzoquinol methylase
MTKVRLHDKEVPLLGTNMHLYGQSHPRFDFMKENYKPNRVLDVGSGEGVFARYCVEKLGCYTVAMDIIEPDKTIPGVMFIRLDAKHMSAVACYNTVLLMEIIEHLEDPRAIIDKCYDALLPGGVILITTPWVDTWDYLEDHVWRFDLEAVLELCSGYISIRAWQDDTFVYAVIGKPDESSD